MPPIVRPKPPAPMMNTTSAAIPVVSPSAGRPQPPARRMPPVAILPKEEPQYAKQEESPKIVNKVPPARKRGDEGTEKPPASELTAPSELAESWEPLGASEGEGEASEQIGFHQYRDMTLVERYALWKKLNKGVPAHVFIPILRKDAMPKQVVRVDAPSAKPADKTAQFCCYCGDWTIFALFSYLGSNRCIGCSISTKDYYNRGANNLWKVEL